MDSETAARASAAIGAATAHRALVQAIGAAGIDERAGWLGGWVAWLASTSQHRRARLAGLSTGWLVAGIDERATSRVHYEDRPDLARNGAERHPPGIAGVGGRSVGVRARIEDGQGERVGGFAGLFLCLPFLSAHEPSPTRRPRSIGPQVPSCKSGEECDSPSRNENGGLVVWKARLTS